MTTEDFRRIALDLPDAVERAHHGHPDFRVRGRVFATLDWPAGGSGMVKLTPQQRELLVAAEPEMFAPVRGAWGRRGATNVRLDRADETSIRSALAMAWRNAAPKSLGTQPRQNSDAAGESRRPRQGPDR